MWNNRESIAEYFTVFLDRDEIMTSFLDVTEENIIRLGQNHVIYTGYYTFFLTKNDIITEVKAKFSYVYVRKPGVPHLLITTHNYGITPQKKTYEKVSWRKGRLDPPQPKNKCRLLPGSTSRSGMTLFRPKTTRLLPACTLLMNFHSFRLSRPATSRGRLRPKTTSKLLFRETPLVLSPMTRSRPTTTATLTFTPACTPSAWEVGLNVSRCRLVFLMCGRRLAKSGRSHITIRQFVPTILNQRRRLRMSPTTTSGSGIKLFRPRTPKRFLHSIHVHYFPSFL